MWGNSMKLLHKLANEHCENMRPGSSVPHTQEFRDAWECRISYEAGFLKAKELIRNLDRVGQWFEVPIKELESIGEEEVE